MVETPHNFALSVDKSICGSVSIVVVHSLRRKRLTGFTLFAEVYGGEPSVGDPRRCSAIQWCK